ncbi:MAG: DUF1295 domain-containing protein [Nitratireductor sp.]
MTMAIAQFLPTISDAWSVALTSLAVIFAGFFVLWVVQIFTNDAGVVDYFWGPGFAVIGWIGLAASPTPASAPVLVFMAVVTVWAVRLAGQLILRHQKSHGEDARYLAMRVAGGRNWWLVSLFKVFTAQSVLLWIMAAPVHAATLMPNATVGVLFDVGLAIAVAGIIIEAVADWQLFRCKAGELRTTFRGGLWSLSRHPNYFGEIVVWCGFALAAFALTGAWWVFIGPALLAAVIVGITLPLTEQHMRKSRSDYAAYQQVVPKLVPQFIASGSGTANLRDPAE